MRKIAFLFPGQGTQFIGMGKFFYDKYEIAKQTFQNVGDVSGIDVAKICFRGNIRQMNDFTNMQLAILAVEVSVCRVYMEEYGIYPQFAAGHSMGEYAALVSAGAVSLTDAAKIMLKRGELVKRIIGKKIGHMTIVENCSAEKIEQCIRKEEADGSVYISCYNANSQNAISGYSELLDKVENLLGDEGAWCTPLLFSPPVHSPIMNGICGEFLEYIASFPFHDFRFPIISNATGDIFSDKNQIAAIMANQLCQPVKFTSVIEVMHKYGVNTTIEMSPKRLLSDFIKADDPEINTLCFGVKNDRSRMEELLKSEKAPSKDSSYFLGRILSMIAASENKNDNAEEYKEVIRIYHLLRDAYERNLQDKKELSAEEKKSYTGFLIKALEKKKLEKPLILEYIKDLLEETNLYYFPQEWMEEIKENIGDDWFGFFINERTEGIEG